MASIFETNVIEEVLIALGIVVVAVIGWMAVRGK